MKNHHHHLVNFLDYYRYYLIESYFHLMSFLVSFLLIQILKKTMMAMEMKCMNNLRHLCQFFFDLQLYLQCFDHLMLILEFYFWQQYFLLYLPFYNILKQFLCFVELLFLLNFYLHIQALLQCFLNQQQF